MDALGALAAPVEMTFSISFYRGGHC